MPSLPPPPPFAAQSAATHRPALARLATVIPAPVSVRPAAGPDFVLDERTTISVSANAEAAGDYLADLLRPATGHPLPVTARQESGDGYVLRLLGAGAPAADGPQSDGVPVPRPRRPAPAEDRPTGHDQLADQDRPAGGEKWLAEGYRLAVTATEVTIRAGSAAGLHHGIQTLRQLLPPAIESVTPLPGPWTVPAGVIVDHPRFPYRGAMLDVARRFFPLAEVLRFIDHLTRYKINHLHLHLTDDQGWRIAIASWPRLAEVGGATAVGDRPGGYYTPTEYRTIVEYAVARHITVVPEIDMPGHTNAALTAYGQLAPDGVAPPPYTGTDVGFSALAVDRELTCRFVEDVLGAVAALTPGPYLHIGGDEAFTLTPEEYARFMDRAQDIVAATGKTVVGWHQLAAARPVPGRVLQYWGTTGAEETVAAAVRQGAKVILSPGNRTYLDMKYAADTRLGKDWAGLIEIDRAYGWDPGDYLVGVPPEAVLGVEAPLWTETVTSLADAEYLTFPRLAAIAELGWSPVSAYGWTGFRDRLVAEGARWEAAGITFHRSPGIPWVGEPPRVGSPLG